MKNNKKIVRKVTESNNIDDIVLRSISSVLERQEEGIWIGTMTELSTALNRVLSKKQRTLFPASPNALRVVINRIINRIRNSGTSVKFLRATDYARTRLVRFSQ